MTQPGLFSFWMREIFVTDFFRHEVTVTTQLIFEQYKSISIICQVFFISISIIRLQKVLDFHHINHSTCPGFDQFEALALAP